MAALLLNIFVTSLSFAIHRGTHLYKMELEFCLGRKFSLEENWERFFFLALFFCGWGDFLSVDFDIFVMIPREILTTWRFVNPSGIRAEEWQCLMMVI